MSPVIIIIQLYSFKFLKINFCSVLFNINIILIRYISINEWNIRFDYTQIIYILDMIIIDNNGSSFIRGNINNNTHTEIK